MKALFIGGSGTISSACARLCAQLGIDLWLLVRGTRDHRIPIGVNVIHGDIKREPRKVHELIKSHNWDCVVDWTALEESDIHRDFKLFNGKTAQFIFISSTAVYQKPLPTPVVNEQTPIGNKFWTYAESKAKCERLVMAYRDSDGFPAVVVRPGHIYAEFAIPSGIAGMGFQMVERIISDRPILVHGDGLGLWTMTWNEDFAQAFLSLMGSEQTIGETYQITSDEMMTWIQIYDVMGRALDREIKFVFASSWTISSLDPALGATLLGDKAHSYIFDNQKIKRVAPNYSPKVPFASGISRCLDWYRSNYDSTQPSFSLGESMDGLIDAMALANTSLEHVKMRSPFIE